MTHVDRYLRGPVPSNENIELSSDDVLLALNQVKKETANWLNGNNIPRQTASSYVSPSAAVSALGELTPGGALMKGFREESLGRELLFYYLTITLFNIFKNYIL